MRPGKGVVMHDTDIQGSSNRALERARVDELLRIMSEEDDRKGAIRNGTTVKVYTTNLKIGQEYQKVLLEASLGVLKKTSAREPYIRLFEMAERKGCRLDFMGSGLLSDDMHSMAMRYLLKKSE